MNRTSAPPDFANSFVLFLPILTVNFVNLTPGPPSVKNARPPRWSIVPFGPS